MRAKHILFVLAAVLLLAGTARAQAPGSINWSGTAHGVSLTCTASTSTVAGYKFYRASVTGGPYTLLNITLASSCSYLDPYTNLAVSTTYYYVATAVDSSGNESVYSNQASVTTPATFPKNPSAPTNLAGTNQ